MSKLLTRLFTSCLFILFVCVPLHAQSATATLSGTISDEASAVIPGVAVTVVNEATSFERTATTNESGSFTVPLLPPGTYTVTARCDGFTSVKVPDVILNVGDQKSVSIQLKVGNVDAEVIVTPDASLINTSPAVATTIDRTFVQNLPLNGRSFSSLVLLTPGVTVAVSSSIDPGQFSVNGQRTSTNYFTVDGVSANIGIDTGIGSGTNLGLAGALPGQSSFGGTNNLVSVDALEEFKIQTSTYTAESGRQPGGQIQIVTRSGTNEFHGSLSEYFRNEALDARNYFNKKPSAQTPLRQNHFGGTFSGPLPLLRFGDSDGSLFTSGKDRTFFFFSYEGQRLRLPTSGSTIVPSIRIRQRAAESGSPVLPILIAHPIPNQPERLTTTPCPAPPSPPDPACDPATQRLFSGFSDFNYSLSNAHGLDAASIRIDHAINEKVSLFGRFNESPSSSNGGLAIKTQTLASTRTLTLGTTWALRPQTINEFRFNYSRQRAAQKSVQTSFGGAVPFDENLLTNGNAGQAEVSIFSGGNSSTLLTGTFADSYQRQINIVDNVSMTMGSHQLKFGIDYRRLFPIYGPQNQTVLFFNNEEAVISGAISEGVIFRVQGARPQFDNFSAYVQDSWKASKRLTVDLGLRWEFNPPPSEADGRLPRIISGIEGTNVINATLAPEGTPFYKTFYSAFAPRLGAAYQVGQTAGFETVLRGGFGVYYDLGSGAAAGGWPLFAVRLLPESCLTFPVTPICGTPPDILTATTSGFALDENLKLPFTLQWNLSVEQSLGKEQTLSVSYVAAIARRLLATQSLNGQGRNPVTGALLPRPNPNFGPINFTYNGPTSDYHSMQVQHGARLKRGLQALINYTWSHAIDEVSSDLQSRFLERGNANFDVRHNLSASVHYEIPRLSGGSLAKVLLRNWSVDAIVHAQSGQPINVGFSSSVLVDGLLAFVRPDLVQGVPIYINDSSVAGGRRFNTDAFASPAVCLPAGSPACVNRFVRQGNFGRNVLRTLPLYQLDLALGRTIKVTEKLGIQLKAEVFNVFNHPMFGDYDANFQSSTFGVPRTTLNNGLGGLSRLYQLGGPRSIQLSAKLSF